MSITRLANFCRWSLSNKPHFKSAVTIQDPKLTYIDSLSVYEYFLYFHQTKVISQFRD
jgi:hypothetical protein